MMRYDYYHQHHINTTLLAFKNKENMQIMQKSRHDLTYLKYIRKTVINIIYKTVFKKIEVIIIFFLPHF